MPAKPMEPRPATRSATGSATSSRRSPRRRDELVEAALREFVINGVSATSVDDIVRAAGVAKGTFYLYFETRDHIVGAVAERLVEGVGREMDRALARPGRTAVDRLSGLALAIGEVGGESHERDLIEVIHRPENAAIHDRLSGRIIARLEPGVAVVIADGIRDGEFAEQDPHRAAALVLACFAALHDLMGRPEDVASVADELNRFILRGLGHAQADGA
jgi:AcrR family transcriptional regulator